MTKRNSPLAYQWAYKMYEQICEMEGWEIGEADPPPFRSKVPECCTEVQFREWKEGARLVGSNVGKAGFCRDCTSERQRKMIAEHRCERPLIAFRFDDDGMEEGYYPKVADE